MEMEKWEILNWVSAFTVSNSKSRNQKEFGFF